MNFERQNFLFKIYFKSLDLCRGHVEERLWTSIIYLRIHAQFAEHLNMLLKLWEGSSLVNTCLGVNMSHFDFWAKKLYTSLFQGVHSRRYHGTPKTFTHVKSPQKSLKIGVLEYPAEIYAVKYVGYLKN